MRRGDLCGRCLPRKVPPHVLLDRGKAGAVCDTVSLPLPLWIVVHTRTCRYELRAKRVYGVATVFAVRVNIPPFALGAAECVAFVVQPAFRGRRRLTRNLFHNSLLPGWTHES